MSPKPIVLDPDLKRLQDEGYEVEVRSGHLLVHSVPYVNSERRVRQGIVVTNLNGNIGTLGQPGDHQVWFVGEYPCHHTGTPIEPIRHTSGEFQLWPGFIAQHRFSNKLYGTNNYPDYYSKMKNYISIIANETKAIDVNATPCTFNVIASSEEASVFKYWDSASSRANIVTISAKLAAEKVAIVGLGGTGSYVLDLIAKTPILQIHLFDGDIFLQHNAFRAPGAAAIDALQRKMPKVSYFTDMYGAMRNGIIPHNYYVTDDNLSDLLGFNFVFLCVDRGAVRKLISGYLKTAGIPFIDVGMELAIGPEGNNLFGTCRATLCTPQSWEHFDKHAPQGSDDDEDLYRSNIQVADMNALNAALAVARWKQHRGFYQDLVQVHHTTYSINSHSLTRAEMTGPHGEQE